MSQSYTIEPGTYRHYKGKDYTVIGVAHFATSIPENAELLGRAVQSGDEMNPAGSRVGVYERDDGTLCYISFEDLGWLVVYRPNYGDQLLTFREHGEFIERVDSGLGSPRFERIGD